MNNDAVKMELSFDGDKFLLRDLNSNEVWPSFYMPSGFYHDPKEKCYVTRSHAAAERTRFCADWYAARELDRKFIRLSAADGNRTWPALPPGLQLKPYQVDGVRFALMRNRAYIAFDMGLGKTIVATVLASVFERAVVYLSPPSLIENIKNEFRTWAPRLRLGVFGEKKYPGHREVNVLLVPDSLFARGELFQVVKEFLQSWGEYEAVLLIDEAHRYKNDTAARTKKLFGYQPKPTKHNPWPREMKGLQDYFDRVYYFSGTPADNGLLDLYSVLHKSAPGTISFMGKFQFAKYFCGAYETPFGWQFNGTPLRGRPKELADKIMHPKGPFMLRIRKKDSGIKFPPKIEELLIVSSKMSGSLAAMDSRLNVKYSESEDLIKKLIADKSDGDDDLHVAEYRRMLGMEKIKFAVEYVNSVLTETHENIILYGFHLDVIEGMMKGLAKWKPYLIKGDTKHVDRQRQVDEFQAGKGRLFIGNFMAMGLGLTLTKADRVIFCEYPWNPSLCDQASDRAHRLGRNETVYVQYMVYQDSLDKRIVETLIRKREIIKSFEDKRD